ncbi:hypothetical protein LguiA_011406 [Lonicera macranthoides]
MENQLQLAVVASTSSSFMESLESQKELFRRQIDQLQNIVLTQCNLTGVNPLSQEMAAGALSIKIGKRPRDLLNPKAVKYMQSIFSIKDAISKKESREISALYGVTATQVREFFTSQRSRVRKFVRLSKEKETRSDACNEANNEPSSSDPNIPINQVPLNSIGPTSVEGHPLNASDEVLPGIDDSEKHFVQNIFSLMRKEETFFGQEKLMEWILQIQNSSVLCWFLTKGGVMILATWLSQAAGEEQTSILHVILKVLCHLPLHKALPVHMSAILQSVNKLRFYKTPDISNRARVLLSRWSKIFARSQAMRKPNAMKSSSDAQDEMLLKQSIGEIMENESWESKADIPEGTSIPLLDYSDNSRKFESPQPLKLLTSADDSNKKLIRGVSSSQNRERRKVQLVEQPGQKTAGRNQSSARSAQPTQSRPLSTDDIQKARMRAQFMQKKYGKAGTFTDVKAQGLNACSSSQASMSLPSTTANVRPRVEEHKKPVQKAGNQQEAVPSLGNKKILEPEEPPLKKLKRVQVPWQTPPEIRISSDWTVGTGENSKEVEIQRNRIRREKEIMYWTVAEIPSDPNEPWDKEMDYDDTLTPVIPTEQLPDLDGAETPVVSPHKVEEIAVTSVTSVNCTATTSSRSSNSNGNVPEPDLELLAVLLKNPELVMALTSGQGGNLSSDETVKLLDMIKANGSVGSNLTTKPEENVEVSLPSPTPSSNTTVTGGWRPEIAKNPFSRQNVSTPIANMYSQEKPVAAPTRLVQPPQTPMVARQPLTMPQPIPQLSLPQKTTPPIIHSSAIPPNRQMSHIETDVNMNSFSRSSLALPNLSAAASPSRRAEPAIGNTRPVPVVMNTLGRQQAPFHLPQLMSTQTQQNRPIPEPITHSWIARQGMTGLNTQPRDNHNNYNPYVQSGPPRERDEYMGEAEFESWSPDNSPVRSTGGWNYAEPRTNFGHNFRPERSRYRNPPPPTQRDIGRRGRDHRDYDRRR